MWSLDHLWQPENYSLHYTYSHLPADATVYQKVEYVDNMLNTILYRAHSDGNYADFRAEITDHYLSVLDDEEGLLTTAEFKSRIEEIHHDFGGYRKVIQLAEQFASQKKKLVMRTFGYWLLSLWPAHVLVVMGSFIWLPILSYLVVIKAALSIFVLAGMYSLWTYFRSKAVRSYAVRRDADIGLFYYFKLELIGAIILPLHAFDNPLSFLSMTANKSLIVFLTYIFVSMTVYHYFICAAKVKPILDDYRRQLVT